MEGPKEFLAETEDAAIEAAARHFGMPRERLEVHVVPREVEISGLAGRVLVLASVREAGSVLGPAGEFLQELVGRMRLPGSLQVRERPEQSGSSVVLSGSGIEEAARREPYLAEALSHLAGRAVGGDGEDQGRVRVEIASGGRRAEGGRRQDGRREDARREEGRRDHGRRDDGGRRDRGPRRRNGPERREASDDVRPPPRDDRLERLAHDMAEEVRRTGQAIELEPMSSRDRWIVHNALREEDGIVSESLGGGETRRVIIRPQ